MNLATAARMTFFAIPVLLGPSVAAASETCPAVNTSCAVPPNPAECPGPQEPASAINGYYRVPCGCSYMKVKAWGAGGCAGLSSEPSGYVAGSGGGGAAVFAQAAVTQNDVFKASVGTAYQDCVRSPGNASFLLRAARVGPTSCDPDRGDGLAAAGGGGGGYVDSSAVSSGTSVCSNMTGSPMRGGAGGGPAGGQDGEGGQVLYSPLPPGQPKAATAPGGTGGNPGIGGIASAPYPGGVDGWNGCFRPLADLNGTFPAPASCPQPDPEHGPPPPVTSGGSFGNVAGSGGAGNYDGGAGAFSYAAAHCNSGAAGSGGASWSTLPAVFYPGDRAQPGKPGHGKGAAPGEDPVHGALEVWFSATPFADPDVPPVPPASRPFLSRSDLLLRHSPSWIHTAWIMNGTTRLSTVSITPNPPADLHLRGASDFNGDQLLDLVFRDDRDTTSGPQGTGSVEIWLMNGAARVGNPVPLSEQETDTAWRLAATGDFSHDGKPDITWRNQVTQKLRIWTMNGALKTGVMTPTPDQAVDGNWSVVATLDFGDDGTPGALDGNTDFLWYNSTSGRIVLWFMDASASRYAGKFTTPPNAGDSNWKVVASGEYGIGPDDPNEQQPPVSGSNDILWRNDTSGNLVVWHMNFNGTRTGGTFTNPSAPPSPATSWTVVGPK